MDGWTLKTAIILAPAKYKEMKNGSGLLHSTVDRKSNRVAVMLY